MKLIASSAFALETPVKWELQKLGYDPAVIEPGQVMFSGDWADVCRTNVWLRIPDRIQIQVAEFPCDDFESLFETLKAMDWSRWLTHDARFPVNAKSRLSQLTSVPAIQRSAKRAIVESMFRSFETQELPETGPEYKIEVVLLRDHARVLIDTTGPSLHKRGYRKLVAQAPIKETLAAAMINLSVWNPSRPLIDPFCGSGTIPIEAALIGLNIAPGMNRQFSAEQWPQISSKHWAEVRSDAQDVVDRESKLDIIGTDIDADVLQLARFHAQRAGVESQIHFQQESFDELSSQKQHGCLITNPPYGERLEDHESLFPLYKTIPENLRRLPTWSHFIITSMPRFEAIVQKSATRRRKLFNGRIECMYYQYLGPRPPKPGCENDGPETVVFQPPPERRIPSTDDNNESDRAEYVTRELSDKTPNKPKDKPAPITPNSPIIRPTKPAVPQPAESQTPESPATASRPPGSNAPGPMTELARPHIPDSAQAPMISDTEPVRDPQVQPTEQDADTKDHEQAALFAARLANRAKHLRRWPSKRQIICFRLYERDIPELPFVVDRYDDHLHITEYDRPHERDPRRHAAWLELMKRTAGETLSIPLENVHLKTRLRQRGLSQYEKRDNTEHRFEIREGDLQFLVNLDDYVDTGLFLDHRVTRAMVRKETTGKHFLNLFAYTGSFSVYAADGGAATTHTVDWSHTYLDWAQDNMGLNGFHSKQHKYIRENATTFIEQRIAMGQGAQKFDVAVVDPPTFSNSKRTEEIWSVQECYAELICNLRKIMSDDGIIYFSTNFRKFKLDETQIPGFKIINISKQTVPEDFRNKRIHQCWKLLVQ